MTEDTMETREKLSALADGELNAEQAALVVSMLADSEQARATWHAYHVVGDALRCADLAGFQDDRAFVARLLDRLLPADEARAPEWATLTPTRPTLGPDRRASSARWDEGRSQAANDSRGRWRFLASAMLLVTVVAVGWQLQGEDRVTVPSGQTGVQALAPVGEAASGVSVAKLTKGAGNEPPVMLRDARLDELLAAHKQFGGTSALQMPAGFLRNATFEPAGR